MLLGSSSASLDARLLPLLSAALSCLELQSFLRLLPWIPASQRKPRPQGPQKTPHAPGPSDPRLDVHRPAARAHPSTDMPRRAAACNNQRGSRTKGSRRSARPPEPVCIHQLCQPRKKFHPFTADRSGDLSVSDTGAALRPDSSQTSRQAGLQKPKRPQVSGPCAGLSQKSCTSFSRNAASWPGGRDDWSARGRSLFLGLLPVNFREPRGSRSRQRALQPAIPKREIRRL